MKRTIVYELAKRIEELKEINKEILEVLIEHFKIMNDDPNNDNYRMFNITREIIEKATRVLKG